MKKSHPGNCAPLATALVVLCLALVFVVVGCKGGGDGKNFKLSLILSQTSDWYTGAKKFKDLVEERTDGEYTITIYPHAQLAGGDQRTELEMLQSGVIDMSMESTILLSLIEPRMSVLSLPWLFPHFARTDSVIQSHLGDELLAFLPPKGITGLAYGANGFRQLTNSRNPVRRPDDLKGMKIRVPGIKLYIDIFKQLGADPSSMNFGELFTALAQKTFDGQENPVTVINSARLYEVQDYLCYWNYSFDPIILCMNNERWNALPPKIQTLFMECADEAMEYQRTLVCYGQGDHLAALQQNGMQLTVIDGDARLAFRKKVEPVYEMYEDVIGADLIRRFRHAARGSDEEWFKTPESQNPGPLNPYLRGNPIDRSKAK